MSLACWSDIMGICNDPLIGFQQKGPEYYPIKTSSNQMKKECADQTLCGKHGNESRQIEGV